MIRQTSNPVRVDEPRGFCRLVVVLSRVLGITLALVIINIFISWFYTSKQLANARSRGVYPSAEEGMRALINESYTGISSSDILYAGPNDSFSSNPHVWYVVAVVRAASYADGHSLGHGGCDAPGTFFLQTNEGWVRVGEGAFPGIIGTWMKMYGMAGEGQSEPSTDNMPQGKLCP